MGTISPERKYVEVLSSLYISESRLLEWDEDLASLCGEAPRRLSCQTAIGYSVPIAMMRSSTINTDSLHDGGSYVDGRYITHYFEATESLSIGGVQILDKTWISTPERALLDCTHYARSYPSVKLVLKSLNAISFSAEQIVHIAERVGMRNAARRLCAISALMRKDHSHTGWLGHLYEYADDLPKDPISLCDYEKDTNRIFGEDERFGVAWDIDPISVTQDVYSF